MKQSSQLSLGSRILNSIKAKTIRITKKHFTSEELSNFLKNKRNLPLFVVQEYKDHLNNCRSCWKIWNHMRWDACREKRGLLELKEYLGETFQEYFDSSWAIVKDWMQKDPKTSSEIAEFYKTTPHYLYNLTIWYESGDRERFEEDFDLFFNKFKVTSTIDFGCGIGNDGLAMIDKGYKAYFVDYQCPSIEFLNWRLNKRRISAEIINVEKIDKLPTADMFWAIDVLEHMLDPLWPVNKLSEQTKVFVHRSEFGNFAGGRHPCHLEFNEINLSKALREKGFKHIPWPTLSVWVRE